MICRNSWKFKNAKFSKKYFFMNFQDMIIWFDLGENTSLGSILKKISYSQNPYCRKAPSFCPHRRKKAFLRDFANFRPNFRILGQQVLTKLFTWKESPEVILQNHNFHFSISWLVLDKGRPKLCLWVTTVEHCRFCNLFNVFQSFTTNHRRQRCAFVISLEMKTATMQH